MAFSRVAALRSCIRARPTAARPQLLRQVARRGYASSGHGHAKAGGDAVWAAGAVAVTVPSCWYILSNAPETSHGHGDHDAHGEEHGKEHEEEPQEETKDEGEDKEESEEKSEDTEKDEGSEKTEDSDSDDDKKEADTPETSDDEGGEESRDDNNTVKTSPDAKGGNKKKLESNKGIKAGESDDSSDKPATSKPTGDKNSQTSKQEGLSNTDTKHSTDISNDSSKSKKSEGGPDTAKAKGTIDPKRPAV